MAVSPSKETCYATLTPWKVHHSDKLTLSSDHNGSLPRQQPGGYSIHVTNLWQMLRAIDRFVQCYHAELFAWFALCVHAESLHALFETL